MPSSAMKRTKPAGKEAPDRRPMRVSDPNFRLVNAVARLENRKPGEVLDEVIENSDLRERLKKLSS